MWENFFSGFFSISRKACSLLNFFWLVSILRSISVSVFTTHVPRALLVATSPSSNAGKAAFLLELELFKSDTFEILPDSQPSANALVLLPPNGSAFSIQKRFWA
jgi:hypothetical protein